MHLGKPPSSRASLRCLICSECQKSSLKPLNSHPFGIWQQWEELSDGDTFVRVWARGRRGEGISSLSVSVSDGFLLASREKLYVCVSIHSIFLHGMCVCSTCVLKVARRCWFSAGSLPRGSDQILSSPGRKLLRSGPAAGRVWFRCQRGKARKMNGLSEM